MSKHPSDFESLEPDFIENVDSPTYNKDADQIVVEIEPPFVFTLNHALTIVVLFSGYLADNYIYTLTQSLFSTIDTDIGPSPNNSHWMQTIPSLIGGVLAPVAGRASDMFGRKYIQMAASIFGIVGSIIAATTNSMRVLMLASAFYGVGYAGHQLALTSIVEIFPKKHRALINGLFIGALIPSTGFGPLISAAIILHSSWRVMFWLPFGLYIFSLVGTFLFYHPEPLNVQKTKNFRKRLIHFDYIGIFLEVTGITTIAMGLLFGGVVFPWISVGVLAPTFLGMAVLIMLVAWVNFNHLQFPFISRSLGFQFWSMWACIFLIGMCCSTTLGMWPNQAQILYEQKPLSLGLLEFPYGLAECLFAPIAGILFFPRHARWILTGYAIALWIFVGTEAIVGKDTVAGSTVLAALNGAMHGATIVVTTIMIQLTVPHEDLGLATNLAFSAFTAGGVAYGIADEVIVNNKLKENIKALVVPALMEAGIPLTQLPEAVTAFVAGQITNPVFATASLTGLMEAGEALKEAWVHVLHFIYLISILFGGLAVLLAVMQKNVSDPVTLRVDARLRPLAGLFPVRKYQV